MFYYENDSLKHCKMLVFVRLNEHCERNLGKKTVNNNLYAHARNIKIENNLIEITGK